jgi:DNA-binding CsgD family transcriptional regulator
MPGTGKKKGSRGRVAGSAAGSGLDGLSRTILDSMSAHIAILDGAGRILEANRAWEEFALQNGMPPEAARRRVSYVGICDGARGAGSEEAARVAQGIRAVLAGELGEFLLDYPCHSPTERRWYYLRVTRIPGRGPMRAVVSHENITPLKLAEERLRDQRAELERKAVELEEVNTALRVLLKQREQDRAQLEEAVFSNLRELVLPHVERLKSSGLKPREKALAESIERQLNAIAAPLLRGLGTARTLLTPRGIQVAALVREGRSTKEIAELLRVSEATVNFHRKSLRRKLGLGRPAQNLRAFLLSLSDG